MVSKPMTSGSSITNPRILYFIVSSIIISLSIYCVQFAVAQTSKTSTYEGPGLGIKVQYPSTWNINKGGTHDDPECSRAPKGYIGSYPYIPCWVEFNLPSDGNSDVDIRSYNLNDSNFLFDCGSIRENCKNITLKDLVRYSYGSISFEAQRNAEVINDKPLTILGNQSAWETESQRSGVYPAKFYTLWTINNNTNTGYAISLFANPVEEYSKYLKQVKEMINTTEFFPLPPPTSEEGTSVTETSETSTYEGPYLGIKVQYPSTWTIDQTRDDPNCSISVLFCQVTFDADISNDRIIPIRIHSYNLNDTNFRADCMSTDPSIADYCRNITLKDFVRYSYASKDAHALLQRLSQVINDKPLTILGNQSAWEMESQDERMYNKYYTLWTINNNTNTGYAITLSADPGEDYDKSLKQVKQMINKIEFFPRPPSPPPPKVPSFLK